MSKKDKLYDNPEAFKQGRPFSTDAAPSAQRALWPGTPGYRSRPGRTGLDPIDTSLEASRLEGLLYKHLFTGTLRPRKRVYIWLMALSGGLLLLPLAVFMAFFRSPGGVGGMLCLWVPFAILGLALWVNTALTIAQRLRSRRSRPRR